MSKPSNIESTFQNEGTKHNNNNRPIHENKMHDEAIYNLSDLSAKTSHLNQVRETILEDRTGDKIKFQLHSSKNVHIEKNKPSTPHIEIPEKDCPTPARFIKDKNGQITQVEYPPLQPIK